MDWREAKMGVVCSYLHQKQWIHTPEFLWKPDEDWPVEKSMHSQPI